MTSVEETALELAGVMAREALSLAPRRPELIASKTNPLDVVTSVDNEIESRLRCRIRDRFPDHAILGEEQGLDDGSPDWTWLLDPIDGTFNFATGLPIAACSIALLRGNRTRVAALGELATNTVFSARAGGGIQSDTAGCTLVPSELGRARLFLDFTPEAPAPELLGALQAFAEIDPVAPRMIGSAAAALLAVAVGGGCFAGVGLRMWDVAAGLLLVEESGQAIRLRNDDQNIVHVLAGDESSVERFEPAMMTLIDLWRAQELPRVPATTETGIANRRRLRGG
jgi:myo-inositol-1(or 4)-monophosphatase